MRITTTLLLCAMLMAVASAQEKDKPPAPPALTVTVTATHDVDSMEHIIAAVYDVISGPMGQKRDWDRFRSLFAPGARLIPVSLSPQGAWGARVLSPDDYVARTQPFFEQQGFFEREVARRVESYVHITHVFSTYESRHAKDDKPFARGINSFQLMYDGQRWWVLSIMWESERPETPLPGKYLPEKGQ